ncbi:MAG: Coenzyme F420 hydrogenase/dehydrogenase, beta subunit C-terminal domain [Candidatus Hodarchaeota archaeon]
MLTKENMIEYLESYNIGYGFQDLCDLVINKKNCIFCGTCASLCPRIGIIKNKPTLLESDPECSLCSRYCARTYFPEEVFEREIFNNQNHRDFILGYYQKAIIAKSTDESILKVAQNGGVITTLLIYALNKGLIDGVLLTNRDENWLPKPFVARTPEEILSCSGSKYTIAPTLISYSDAIHEYELEKLAFVGMPCQILAARKLQLCPPLSDKLGQFKIIIGIFCSVNYKYDLIEKIFVQDLNKKLENVSKFDISDGILSVISKDGSIIKLSTKYIKEFIWPSCRYCKDFTSEYADISVGNVGAPSGDFNSLIVRSDIGKSLLDNAISEKRIITTNTIDLAKIKMESLRKKSEITKVDKKIISALRFFNIPDLEAKVYATLISLGYTNIALLSDVMKMEYKKIYKALEKLKRRKWIVEFNGGYRTINPIQVMKNEITKFKANLEKKINKFKSEVLKELEILFLQNNIQHIKYNEYNDFFY